MLCLFMWIYVSLKHFIKSFSFGKMSQNDAKASLFFPPVNSRSRTYKYYNTGVDLVDVKKTDVSSLL